MRSPSEKSTNPKGTSPSGKSNREVCRNHLEGICKNGDACDFFIIPDPAFSISKAHASGEKYKFSYIKSDNAAQTQDNSNQHEPNNEAKTQSKAQTKGKANSALAMTILASMISEQAHTVVGAPSFSPNAPKGEFTSTSLPLGNDSFSHQWWSNFKQTGHNHFSCILVCSAVKTLRFDSVFKQVSW